MRKLFPRLHEDGALSHAVHYMVADSAGAIKNGEVLVNGPLEHDEEKLLTCYSHMLRGHFTSFVQAPDQETKTATIKDDLRRLHRLPYGFTAAFDYLVERWKEKWNALGQEGMVKWFTKEWLGRNKRGSRAHVHPGLANSSNQIERANGTLKVLCGKRRMSATEAID